MNMCGIWIDYATFIIWHHDIYIYRFKVFRMFLCEEICFKWLVMSYEFQKSFPLRQFCKFESTCLNEDVLKHTFRSSNCVNGILHIQIEKCTSHDKNHKHLIFKHLFANHSWKVNIQSERYVYFTWKILCKISSFVQRALCPFQVKHIPY